MILKPWDKSVSQINQKIRKSHHNRKKETMHFSVSVNLDGPCFREKFDFK